MERLRTTRNRCRREGISVDEVCLSEIDPSILIDISRDWLTTKRVGSELQFLARPLAGRPISENNLPEAHDFTLQDDDGVRLFVARSALKEPIGFVVFDPIFRYGHIDSYAASILRCRRMYRADAESPAPVRVPSGLIDVIILEAAERFQDEGIRSISLGLMPFAPRAGNDWREHHTNRLTAYLFDLLYSFGSPLFNFRSLTWHKKRYRGREEPVYFAGPQKVAQLWHLHQTNAMMGFRYTEAVRNILLGRR
jgi:hypothetical protein